jgi:predicted phosphodiesterase
MNYLITLLSILFPLNVGLVSDIHYAGKDIRTNSEGQTVYPIKGKEKFSEALDQLKDTSFILVLGDSLNNGSKKRARDLKAEKSEVPVIWVKGNHDNDAFEILSPETYYKKRVGLTDIMVLDTNYQKKSSIGGISPEQKEWIEKNIEGVEIIAMHHPILENGEIIMDYEWLYHLIKKHKVKRVYSGHRHFSWQKDEFRGVGALTDTGFERENLTK